MRSTSCLRQESTLHLKHRFTSKHPMHALALCEPIQPDSLFSASTSPLSFILNVTFNPQTLASASATVPTSAGASVPASASALSPALMPALSLSHKQLQLEPRSLSHDPGLVLSMNPRLSVNLRLTFHRFGRRASDLSLHSDFEKFLL